MISTTITKRLKVMHNKNGFRRTQIMHPFCTISPSCKFSGPNSWDTKTCTTYTLPTTCTCSGSYYWNIPNRGSSVTFTFWAGLRTWGIRTTFCLIMGGRSMILWAMMMAMMMMTIFLFCVMNRRDREVVTKFLWLAPSCKSQIISSRRMVA